jgi:hypothetical protein
MNIGVGIGVSFNSARVSGGGGGPVTLFSDNFNRANSSSTLGSPWVASSGIYGISSNQAYCVSNGNADTQVVPVGGADYTLTCDIFGAYGTTNFSFPGIMVRYIDESNYIYVKPQSNNITLNIWDTSATTTPSTDASTALTDSTTYTLKIICNGTSIQGFINNVLKVSATLNGSQQTKFGAATKVGFRLSTGGTPAVTARWDNLSVTT